MYRKSYERDCISWYMGRSDAFQVLKIAWAAQLENLKNITSDHLSRNALAFIRVFIYNILNKIIKKKIKKTRRSRLNGQATLKWLPNCSHVLFQPAPINYNLVTDSKGHRQDDTDSPMWFCGSGTWASKVLLWWAHLWAWIFRKTLWTDQIFIIRAWKIS